MELQRISKPKTVIEQYLNRLFFPIQRFTERLEVFLFTLGVCSEYRTRNKILDRKTYR